MDSLYRNIQKMNGLCKEKDHSWNIKYYQRDHSYEGEIGDYTPNGWKPTITLESDYLDDLVERLINSIESSS